jgi:hypothetical protein
VILRFVPSARIPADPEGLHDASVADKDPSAAPTAGPSARKATATTRRRASFACTKNRLRPAGPRRSVIHVTAGSCRDRPRRDAAQLAMYCTRDRLQPRLPGALDPTFNLAPLCTSEPTPPSYLRPGQWPPAWTGRPVLHRQRPPIVAPTLGRLQQCPHICASDLHVRRPGIRRDRLACMALFRHHTILAAVVVRSRKSSYDAYTGGPAAEPAASRSGPSVPGAPRQQGRSLVSREPGSELLHFLPRRRLTLRRSLMIHA